ncbi:MAG TPA: collagen-binding domain-containing protein [Pseudolysinimonas sp.]|nr:collagen-binding domain-containing protein [Pseudolysinimonas sp.]
MLRKLLAGATTVLVASALSLIAVAAPASATVPAPMADLHGFTVLTEGNATTSASASETEGAWAVGGDLTLDKAYVLGPMHTGSLPNIGGQDTHLLVDGKVSFGVNGEALDVNAGGSTRVGNVTGYDVSNDHFFATGNPSTYVRMAASSTLANVTAGTLYADTFGGAFTSLRANSASIAGLNSPAATMLTLIDGTNFNGISGSDKGLQLTSGAVNVLRISAAQLSAVSNIKFLGGVSPSSSTPLYVDVTDSGDVSVSVPDLLNVDAAGAASYVLYNFSHATTLDFGGHDKVDGSLLAPNAAVVFSRGTYEGQIAAKSFTHASAGEIHHIGFGGGLPQTVAGSVSQTDACDSPSNSLTVNAVAGIVYHWTSALVPAGQTTGTDFTSFSGTGLAPGSYSFSIAATGGYSLGSNPASYQHTFSATDTCVIPDATGSFSFADASCTTATGGYTLNVPSHATYTVSVTQPTGSAVTTAGIAPASPQTVTGLPVGTLVSISVVHATGHSLAGGVTASDSHTILAATDCPEPKAATGSFSFQDASCSTSTGGYTLTVPTHATYTVTVTPVGGAGSASTGLAPTAPRVVTGLAVGATVDITVVRDTGFAFIDGVVQHDTHVIAAASDCPIALHLQPKASPETCVDGSQTGDTRDGTITIAHLEHVSFTITPASTGVAVPVDTVAPGDHVFPYPHGDYLVTAVLDSGFTTTDPLTAPVTVGQPALPCTLQTDADLPTQVDHTDAVCQTDGSSAGSITVGPADSLPWVNYFIDGKQVTAATTVVPSGVHQVTAAVNQTTAPGDTLQEPGPWTVTIVAGSTIACADLTTLALTGGNSLGWIVLAAILLQLGVALLAFPIIRQRRRGAHLA